jgi:hypothetical protein
MKRVLLTVAVALLIPSALMAFTPMIGVYFEGHLTYTPAFDGNPFSAHLYTVQEEYNITGIEYSLVTPMDPMHTMFAIIGWSYPPNFSVASGDPWNGHAVTYWPPFLAGFPDGYNLLVTYECLALTESCDGMWDYPIEVHPDPRSGFLRGTYEPDNEFFDFVPLTSWLCPEQIGTEEESWGAIKSMYK